MSSFKECLVLAFALNLALSCFAQVEEIAIQTPSSNQSLSVNREGGFITFEDGDDRYKLRIGSHYARVEGKIVSLNSGSPGLMIDFPLTISNENETSYVDQTPLCLNFESFFDWRIAFGVDSRLKLPLSISGVTVYQGGFDVSVNLLSGETGTLKFSNEFLVLAVTIGQTSVPIFDQAEALAFRSSVQPHLSVEKISAPSGEILVWQKHFEVERISPNSSTMTVAKAVVGGRELCWIGPRPKKWVVLDNMLYGVLVYEPFTLLIRSAIASIELDYLVPKQPMHIKDLISLEERFGGGRISIKNDIRDLLSESDENVRIRQVNADQRKLRVRFSVESGLAGEIFWVPESREATLVMKERETALLVD